MRLSPFHLEATDTVDVLLRDPSCRDAETGQLLSVPAFMLEWNELRVISDGTCDHCETVCYRCLGEWEIDHFVVVSSRLDEVLYQSPDTPVEG